MKNLFTITIALFVLAVVRPASARTWSAETVDDQPGDVGQVSSIALDSNGRPRIAYFDLINGHLKYASKTPLGGWQIYTIDASGNAGFGLSLALDGQNNPHISYYRSTGGVSTGDLKVANGSCSVVWGFFSFCSFSTETVAVGVHSAFAAGNTSIVLDGAGNPHVSYFDHTAHQLKWAKKTAANGWSLANVASSAGGHTSLAIDSFGFPQIGWSDSETGTIKYARVLCYFILCGWGIDTVDSGSMGTIKLTAADQPRISYTSGDNVKFTAGSCTRTEAGCVWTAQQVASGASSLAHPTLVLNAAGSPFISFLSERGFGLSSLHFARKWLWSWAVETADFDVDTLGSSSLCSTLGAFRI